MTHAKIYYDLAYKPLVKNPALIDITVVSFKLCHPTTLENGANRKAGTIAQSNSDNFLNSSVSLEQLKIIIFVIKKYNMCSFY